MIQVQRDASQHRLTLPPSHSAIFTESSNDLVLAYLPLLESVDRTHGQTNHASLRR